LIKRNDLRVTPWLGEPGARKKPVAKNREHRAGTTLREERSRKRREPEIWRHRLHPRYELDVQREGGDFVPGETTEHLNKIQGKEK